jgi:hypothetical protein
MEQQIVDSPLNLPQAIDTPIRLRNHGINYLKDGNTIAPIVFIVYTVINESLDAICTTDGKIITLSSLSTGKILHTIPIAEHFKPNERFVSK